MPGKQKTIVVVDDEPQVLSLLEAYLAQSGFTVLTAHSGAALDHVLAAQPVDLVLLDVMLGNENGFTIADRLRQ
ncbi:MAG TPA: response regulator, partial [Rhodospirillaceae bacterium]|nr:response regulator [Rhodospirillaceae bacterium]